MITKMIALDWRAMKVYQIRLLLLPVFALILGWLYPVFVIPISVFMCISFSINPFAVEEKGELNHLYLTLPVNRKAIVTGRYALSLIMLFCGIIMGIAIMPLASLMGRIFMNSIWVLGFSGYIAIISLSCLFYSLLNLFMFPILFRIGYAKGKIWGFYLPAIFFAILIGIYTTIISIPGNETITIEFIGYASENMLLVSGGMVILAIAFLFLSYALSIKLYAKRDF